MTRRRNQVFTGLLIPGAEKNIVWADQPGDQTALSVVYLHGFSATRQEAAPLAEEVAAALGAHLYPASEVLAWPWGETIARMVIGPENH